MAKKKKSKVFTKDRELLQDIANTMVVGQSIQIDNKQLINLMTEDNWYYVSSAQKISSTDVYWYLIGFNMIGSTFRTILGLKNVIFKDEIDTEMGQFLYMKDSKNG